MDHALQAKDAKIQALLADRARLDAALTSIKRQISSAASPARPDLHQTKALLRTSLHADTLRQALACCGCG